MIICMENIFLVSMVEQIPEYSDHIMRSHKVVLLCLKSREVLKRYFFQEMS